MRLGVVAAAVLVSLLILLSGRRAAEPSARATQPVTEEEWKRMRGDWYADGRFDREHRCVAVREAIEQLPSRSPEAQTLHQDFRVLEARAC